MLKIEAQLARFDEAASRAETLATVLESANKALASQQTAYAEIHISESTARTNLGAIRVRRGEAEQAVMHARSIQAARVCHSAITRVRVHVAEVRRLEGEIAKKAEIVRGGIDATALDKLRLLDRAETEARAIFEAGAVTIDIQLLGDTDLQIDGKFAIAGRHDIVRPSLPTSKMVMLQRAPMRSTLVPWKQPSWRSATRNRSQPSSLRSRKRSSTQPNCS